MLGGLFALLAAATFAWTNAAVRRGVLTGTAAQATTLSLPAGIPVFFAALLLSGQPGLFFGLSRETTAIFAIVGVTHFCVGRYFNYRAIKAIGTNLAGPVMQFNLVVSLVLAMVFLGERLTPLRILGIALIVAGTAVIPRGRRAANNAAAAAFTPALAEGYVCALMAAICYGVTPVLVRYALHGQGLAASLAGGLIAAVSSVAVAAALMLVPSQRREIASVEPEAAKWFLSSAILVYVSQTFAYMAVTIAPVTVTAPMVGLAYVFRLHFSRWLNPKHEVFGREVIAATALSFLGVVALSFSVDALPLPPAWSDFLHWQWP